MIRKILPFSFFSISFLLHLGRGLSVGTQRSQVYDLQLCLSPSEVTVVYAFPSETRKELIYHRCMIVKQCCWGSHYFSQDTSICWEVIIIPVIYYKSKWLIFFFKYLFIYLWLCWVFVSVRGLSLVVASGDHSSSQCAGLSLSRPLLLWSTGSRRAGSVVVAHGPSCSAACGIFPDQGSNPCPLHWQADSQPLRHQGSPKWLNF